MLIFHDIHNHFCGIWRHWAKEHRRDRGVHAHHHRVGHFLGDRLGASVRHDRENGRRRAGVPVQDGRAQPHDARPSAFVRHAATLEGFFLGEQAGLEPGKAYEGHRGDEPWSPGRGVDGGEPRVDSEGQLLGGDAAQGREVAPGLLFLRVRSRRLDGVANCVLRSGGGVRAVSGAVHLEPWDRLHPPRSALRRCGVGPGLRAVRHQFARALRVLCAHVRGGHVINPCPLF
mmetsp:Transcript_69558/g.213249  ORF Transcript_69558/g.213249 Transcript_69558/m.213249 type:complete len:230 (-) Transcript_69558:346-1035(-)